MTDHAVEELDLENMGAAVAILSVVVLKLQITLGVFYPRSPLA